MQTQEQDQVRVLAAEAGFHAAVGKIDHAREMKRKLAIAYEHHQYVTSEQYEAFEKELYRRTYKRQGNPSAMAYWSESYDKLASVPVEKYPGVPPNDVLKAVKVARDRGVFDAMEVVSVESVERKVWDPIVFGRIAGCTDRFFIAEWGEDVKLADILGAGGNSRAAS